MIGPPRGSESLRARAMIYRGEKSRSCLSIFRRGAQYRRRYRAFSRISRVMTKYILGINRGLLVKE